MSSEAAQRKILEAIAQLDRWRHRIPLGHGIVTPGREDSADELTRIKLPKDLTGKQVLDIGCSDGFFSFECEQRGAQVVGVDDFTSTPYNSGKNGFTIAKEILNSKAELMVRSIYALSPADMGHFDLVLFLNVLYHLQHPCLALEKISSVMKPGGQLLLKTYFHQDLRLGRWGIDLTRRPVMRFFGGDELNDDPSNWWVPNRRCIEEILQTSGFAEIECLGSYGKRIYYRCVKAG